MKLKATLNVEFTQDSKDMTHLTQAEKTAAAAYEKAKAEMASVAEQVFQRCINLLMEKAMQPWTKIMSEQIDAAPWTDIQGVKHAEHSWSE